MGFVLKSKASNAAVKKSEESAGGGRKRFKVEGERADILVLGPVSETGTFFGTNIAHTKFGADKKFICKSASPSAFEQKDKLIDIGWKLRNKYDPSEGKGEKHPNKKLRDLWKDFMPAKQTTIYVLDLKNVDKGAQLYDMPVAVKELLFEEVKEYDGDLESICDLQNGRKLMIKKTGSGFNTKYSAKFSQNTASLNLDEAAIDAIVKTITSTPLGKLNPDGSITSLIQEKFNEADYEKVCDYALKRAERLGVNIDDLDADGEDDDAPPAKDGKGEKTEEIDDEFEEEEAEIVDPDDEIIDEEEEGPPPVKPGAKPAGKPGKK